MAAIQLAAILGAAISVSLSGCVLKPKPKMANATPVAPRPVPPPAPAAPPPAPLSIRQTHAELPAPQPISQEALATTEPPGEPPPPPPVTPRPARRTPTVAAQPKPEPAPPTAPVAAPAEPERAPIQEIVPPEELDRLRANADARKREINQRLSQLPRHGLSAQVNEVVETIRSFVKLSDEAERAGDMRRASELADRGAVLAQGLPGAK